MGSATIVREATWLEENGADVIIAQGAEAGGHRGMFLTENIANQPGIFALLPQVVDAVRLPVVAAGGIADGRGIAAPFALGAAGVQIGTAYLRCPESKVIAPARAALAESLDDSTVITNVMTGRPARGVVNRVMREIGPVSPHAPAFPHAATRLAPLKAAAEKLGKVDFTNLWAGQAVRLGRELPAAELTRALAGALARIAVTDAEVPHLQGELNAMLAFVEQLSEVDVDGVEPMTSVTPMEMKKRPDVVNDGEIVDQVIANAPATEDHFFLVPKVVE